MFGHSDYPGLQPTHPAAAVRTPVIILSDANGKALPTHNNIFGLAGGCTESCSGVPAVHKHNSAASGSSSYAFHCDQPKREQAIRRPCANANPDMQTCGYIFHSVPCPKKEYPPRALKKSIAPSTQGTPTTQVTPSATTSRETSNFDRSTILDLTNGQFDNLYQITVQDLSGYMVTFRMTIDTSMRVLFDAYFAARNIPPASTTSSNILFLLDGVILRPEHIVMLGSASTNIMAVPKNFNFEFIRTSRRAILSENASEAFSIAGLANGSRSTNSPQLGYFPYESNICFYIFTKKSVDEAYTKSASSTTSEVVLVEAEGELSVVAAAAIRASPDMPTSTTSAATHTTNTPSSSIVEAEAITVKIKDETGDEIHFKVKRTTKMRKIIDAYARKRGVTVENLKFLFDGCRVDPFQSPESMNLEDGYQIDASYNTSNNIVVSDENNSAAASSSSSETDIEEYSSSEFDPRFLQASLLYNPLRQDPNDCCRSTYVNLETNLKSLEAQLTAMQDIIKNTKIVMRGAVSEYNRRNGHFASAATSSNLNSLCGESTTAAGAFCNGDVDCEGEDKFKPGDRVKLCKNYSKMHPIYCGRLGCLGELASNRVGIVHSISRIEISGVAPGSLICVLHNDSKFMYNSNDLVKFVDRDERNGLQTTDSSTAGGGNALTIKIKNDRDVTHFRIRDNMPMQKVFTAFEQKNGTLAGSFKFVFNGTKIAPDKTARMLGLVDGSEVEVKLRSELRVEWRQSNESTSSSPSSSPSSSSSSALPLCAEYFANKSSYDDYKCKEDVLKANIETVASSGQSQSSNEVKNEVNRVEIKSTNDLVDELNCATGGSGDNSRTDSSWTRRMIGIPTLTTANCSYSPSFSDDSEEEGLKSVQRFTVECRLHGKVEWLGEVDVRGLNLDEIVSFIGHAELDVKPHPQFEHRLNIPAIVTIYNMHVDPKEEDAKRLELFEMCLMRNFEFIEFDAETGNLTFRVDKFY